ncbi:EAL domain-containing protein [Cellulomonas sp. zg-ZUI188]|uniref:EAL domain-containing protein n=2 Tax=Cellulomonas fengjieae TaxID=2819978 RepID=A0ABS3SE02_9CELL|nr:EAL domain-containing protein [Cellulomonas fengjieae]MBO3083981.1 EAL domain-containing protein [Cellulomonas fengjieae]MBO3101268.1 EAL domain-containing protein [Cellulomonas fengjieae]QVI64752.1 EAL domain-containing protein [Cellulomonas fengjieae]
MDGQLFGNEFLYRSRDGLPAQVDRWRSDRQDVATAMVLDVLFGDGPPADTTFAFVNITRSFLVNDRPLPAHPGRLVLEVVESVRADDAVLAGLQRLRQRGYRIAIDDFVGDADQVKMMPYADFVKLDCRDVRRQGAGLVQLARRHGARLVAERVSDSLLVEECRAWGFDFMQGDLLGPAVTERS